MRRFICILVLLVLVAPAVALAADGDQVDVTVRGTQVGTLSDGRVVVQTPDGVLLVQPSEIKLVATPTPTPTPTPTLFDESFDSAKCSPDVWGTNPWITNACPRAEMQGDAMATILHSVADLSKPTNVGATLGDTDMQRWWSYETWDAPAVQVSADVKPQAWDSDAQSWNEFAFYVRRVKGESEASFYGVIPYERDGHYHIEKKCIGSYSTNSVLKPFETGTTSQSHQPYAYYLLDNAGVAPLPAFNVWHHFAATAENQPDGSVVVTMLNDGQQRLQVKDYPGLTGCAPFLSGATGWRSDNQRLEIEDFRLEQLP